MFLDKPVTDAVWQVLNPEYYFKLCWFFLFNASQFILIYLLIYLFNLF